MTGVATAATATSVAAIALIVVDEDREMSTALMLLGGLEMAVSRTRKGSFSY
jgi:hypothetical protein